MNKQKRKLQKKWIQSNKKRGRTDASTTIVFNLPKRSEVTLRIFNILGHEVETLVSDRLTAGSYEYRWDAINLASGVYLYKLQSGSYVETRKMVLMR